MGTAEHRINANILDNETQKKSGPKAAFSDHDLNLH